MNQINYEYDSEGNLVKVKDDLGLIMNISYDALNNPVSITDALGNKVINEFNSLNRLIKQNDPLGRERSYHYDEIGRLIQVTDPNGSESIQELDKAGRITNLIDPNNSNTTFTYDELGRLIKESYDTGKTISYTYNALDLVAEIKNGRDQITTKVYDEVGRLVKIIELEGETVYSYDKNGNVLTVTDKEGTITREYDALNRVVSYKDPNGNTIGYQYDQVGNLEKIIYPDGKVVTYTYDANNLLKEVTDWNGRSTTYSYNPRGQVTEIIRPNQTRQINEYDELGRLVKLIDQDKDGNIISNNEYEYDEVGNVLTEQTNHVLSYRPTEINMTYGSNNLLVQYNGEDIEYDEDGNMIVGPLQGEMVAYNYDSRNRLTSAGDLNYQYDAENNRIGVTSQTGTRQYVVNPHSHLSQVLVETDETGTNTYYIYGLGLIGHETGDDYYTYHFDRRGSTIALSDENGEITDRYGYGVYGDVVRIMGATETPFLYHGSYGVMRDANGLTYMRARYYNHGIKRFINQDILIGSIEDGRTLNRYAYVNGNPISYIDPFGLSADSDQGFWSNVRWDQVGIGIFQTVGGVFEMQAGYTLALVSLPTGPGAIIGVPIGGYVVVDGFSNTIGGASRIYEGFKGNEGDPLNFMKHGVYKNISPEYGETVYEITQIIIPTGTAPVGIIQGAKKIEKGNKLGGSLDFLGSLVDGVNVGNTIKGQIEECVYEEEV